MPFFKSRKSTNRRGDSTGFLTYSDAYQLIKENIDEAVEFYELEPDNNMLYQERGLIKLKLNNI